MISHFRGGDECGVAQWNGSCQKSHEDFASSHQLLVEAFEVHLATQEERRVPEAAPGVLS